jgi:peptidoglycan hydrolase-like protein with peptidoglycan-binding domain
MNNIIAGLNANTAPTTPSTPTTVPALTTFTRDLQLGDTGSDVLALQQYLNTHGFIVAKNGAGSPGHETTTFGPATEAALIKFQKAQGITPAVGYFGPMTRKEVNASVK